MSDTPETERETFDDPTPGYDVVSADFARRLERERDEARSLAKYWQEQYGHANPEHEWQELPWNSQDQESA